MIPITPKMWGYIGIGIAVLGLIAGILWQMNKLIKIGQELGEARSVIADLRLKIQTQRDTDRATWDKLREDLVKCEERVTAATAIGDEWKTKWEEIRRRPPREVIVEVEAETWHESLVEGHEQFLAGLERIRSNEDAPSPPG